MTARRDSGEAGARRALVEAGRHLHERGLLAGTAGNLSLRLADGRVLVTPRGTRKDRLDADGIVVIDPTDPDPDAVARATSEWPLHRACYEGSDVGAVVHTHAPGLTALGLGDGDGDARLAGGLPEVAAAVGGVATVAYRPSGSEALARGAAAAVEGGAGVLLLERHGAVSVGADLEEALDRMELAELAARAVALAG